jgi:crossover junction endodeoxyribonuclease RusA
MWEMEVTGNGASGRKIGTSVGVGCTQNSEVGMIELIWPPRDLHPNARTHWAKMAKLTASYREHARAQAAAAKIVLEPEGKIFLMIEFCQPDNRARDLDGMLSNLKAGLDGIADGLEVNDRRFRPSLDWGENVKGGGVRIFIKEIV